ncbi:unnamed protein product [Tilletia controversa]|nr:unnamed protein product [Tilletia controversa]
MTGREAVSAKGRGKDSLSLDQLLAEANKVAGSRDSIDWLAKWAKLKLAEQRNLPQGVSAQPLDSETSVIVASLISAGLDSDNAATQQRAQTLLRSVLDMVRSKEKALDQVEHLVPGSAFQAVLLQPASAQPELKKSLLVLEAFVDAFGTRILGPKERVQAIFFSLTAGLTNVDGGPRRRAALIVSIIKASYPTQSNGSYSDIGWQDALRDTMCGTSEVSRTYIREYVLPYLYDHEPAVFKMLCVKLSSDPTSSMDTLRAALALLKPARQQGLCCVNDRCRSKGEVLLGSVENVENISAVTVIPTELVELCILSADDEVSTGALALLSQSKSSSSPFEPIELRLLLRYFTSNIAATDAGTRSRVTAMFCSVLTRLRMSTYASARTLAKLRSTGKVKVVGDPAQLKDELVQAETFMMGIFRLCCQNLWPGASYPSMLSSLNYLDLLLSSKLDPRFGREDSLPGANNESTAEASKALHKSMKHFRRHSKSGSQDSWPFELKLIDDILIKTLLSCFSSTFDDIRNLARRILIRCPTPLEGLSPDGQLELLQPAKRLLLSARASQTGTATALLQTYGHVLSSKTSLEPVTASQQSSLVHSLLDFANKQVAFAEQSGVAAAAEQHPLHGCLWALQQVFVEDSLQWSDRGQDHVQQIIERTMQLIDQVWALVQPILSSQEAAAQSEADVNEEPEAAQPDLELARAISLAGGEDSNSTDVASVGPYKHQILLSYGWRSMKEASALLRVLAVALSKSAPQAMSTSIAEQIGAQYLEWMTKIRHRGAFSVIYPELSTVAASLIASDRNGLLDLPQEWLDRLTSDICSRDNSFSTTRRSAGLSYAVLALLQAFQTQPKLSQTVTRTVTLRIAQEADRLQSENRSGDDGRQVHLFNITRILVLDGRVGPQLVPIIGQLLRLAVSRFQSNSWDLSNVAMLLFSATINRAFASRQQQNKDETGRKASFDKFFADHTGLADFLIDELLRLQADQSGSGTASGSLFALMAFIARLQATAGDVDDTIAKRFRSALTQGSQSHALLRDIAGRAFASTVTVEEAISYGIAALHEIDSAALNHTHGILLRVHFLTILALQACVSTQSASDAETFARSLQEASNKVLKEGNSSPDLIVTALVDLWRTTSILLRLHKADDSTACTVLRKLCLQELDEQKVSKRLDRSRCSNCLTNASFALLDLEAGSHNRVLELLKHSADSVREATLSYIHSNPQLLVHEDSLALLPLPSEGTADRIVQVLWEAWDTPCVPLREHLVQYASWTLVSWVLKLGTASNKVAQELSDCARLLTEIIKQAAGEDESVESRLAAVRCLRILALLIFDTAFVNRSLETEALAVDILELQLIAVRIVEDDDEDVRHEAARALAEGLSYDDNSKQDSSNSATSAMMNSLHRFGGSPQTAKEGAWRWLHRLYSDLDHLAPSYLRWCSHLWAQILPSPAQFGEMYKRAFEARTALFAVEEPNQYRDRTHDVLLAARILTESEASRQSIKVDLKYIGQSLQSFATALKRVQNRPELGDITTRYVLGLRLVLAAKIAQAAGHRLSSDTEVSTREITDGLALMYALDTVRTRASA